MKTRSFHSVAPLLGFLLFMLALWFLFHELKTYHFTEIVAQTRALPRENLLLSFTLTVLSYLVMTGYDFLALRYIRQPLAYGRIALASFVGYAFSNNIGLSMLAGGSVRFRLYSAWGLSTVDIAKVVAFCTATLWLGFLALAGVVFICEPLTIPQLLHLPFNSARVLGAAALALVLAVCTTVLLRKKPFTFRGWEFSLPPLRLFGAQLLVASLDWALSSAVLFVLLPHTLDLSYPAFLAIFLLGQLAGLASQIPGGLGVFETVTLVLLSPKLPATNVLASLVVFRGLYYLLPLGTAALLLGVQEMLQSRHMVRRIAGLVGEWVTAAVPQVLALTTFAGGVILLFSGATPAEATRFAWLQKALPLPIVEASHFLGSLAGIGLLILARGLQRRLDAAYVLTSLLLGGGVVFSLLKGLDVEEACILGLMLIALLPCHRYFYRKASLIGERFTVGWVLAITLVLLSSVWLVLFSYKHMEYANDLWWRITFLGHAPRSLRATVGAIGLALLFATAKLLRPARPMVQFPQLHEYEKVLPIIQQSAKTYVNLALLGDKTFLASKSGNSFIMYAVEGRSWVALGDPIGPPEEWPELIWQYRELCDRYDGWPVFYEVSASHLHLYLDAGLEVIKYGEEGAVHLPEFSLEGSGRKGLRHTVNKIEKEGCSFEIVRQEDVPPLLSKFKEISDAWLSEKHTREKGFSLGSFREEYLRHFPSSIVRKNGNILAFTNIWTTAQKEELSIDLMRYLPEAPHGVMDYLFVHLMLWGKQQGYTWFSLGMAPFAGMGDHPLAPLWSRLGAFLFQYGEHFYNFQGLRQYKEKFDPQWEPKYLATPGGFTLPRILTNIASLISGGMQGVVAK